MKNKKNYYFNSHNQSHQDSAISEFLQNLVIIQNLQISKEPQGKQRFPPPGNIILEEIPNFVFQTLLSIHPGPSL